MTSIPKYEIYYSGLDGYLDGKRSDGRPGHQSLLSEGAPLLPIATPPAHHLPISLRMAHSPWRFIRQKPLAAIRTLITLYLTFILVISLYFEILFVKHAKLYAFEAGHLSLLVQVIFYWISTIWTFHHIIKPARIHLGEDVLPKGFWQKVGAFFEPPTSTEPNSKKMLAFSVFYTAASTFPFLVTIIYWLCLFRPEPAGIGHIVLRYFIIVNVYGVTAIVAFLEIVLLNSARKQKPYAQHVQGLFVLVIIYLIWAVIGRLITGEYVYTSLDPRYAGWGAVVSNDLALLSYTLTAFSIQRGLQDLREKAMSKGVQDRTSH